MHLFPHHPVMKIKVFISKLVIEHDRPVWLQEHMQHPFPTEHLFEDLRREWTHPTSNKGPTLPPVI
jgi:hypothetical protein